MLRAIVAVVALLLAAVAYYVDDLIKKRKQLDGLVSITPPPAGSELQRVMHASMLMRLALAATTANAEQTGRPPSHCRRTHKNLPE
ncbi:hypothetical protein PFICI_04548 [Pestalotiopsis fici W106-1]|uniref:Uncharacterized protein n=1 Tax=Pestalotiopsis fici (strain W106-1 / CGMCC3.15140) TaxID=1229662 RepID=W3XB43_PESFW|nr:uncharacterized protein PFICI_04548 [Pestalotiopsis fici W106-1]ETS82672.1 hypothetical protein PFICI_04548 [Pestalotiopsis fici W106-1]